MHLKKIDLNSGKYYFNQFKAEMNVIKRNGDVQEVSFDKIFKRLKFLVHMEPMLDHVNTHMVTKLVIESLFDGVTTTSIDIQSANICSSLGFDEPQYLDLASRIVINNHHKNTVDSFKTKTQMLYNNVKQGNHYPLVKEDYFEFVTRHYDSIESMIDYSRDYRLDYSGFKTLEKTYLKRTSDDTLRERPQDLFMRVAIAIHREDELDFDRMIKAIQETYDYMSFGYFTHATPTLFNAGTTTEQDASCFLGVVDDSIPDIFNALKKCAIISKFGGGIGMSVSSVRCSGSDVQGTGGKSNGIVPMIKCYETTAMYVNQGGRRPGSFAMYLEMQHPDILAFLMLCRKNINEEFRANKIFPALWICDLFMKRVKEDGKWSTFCPNDFPDLYNTYGEEFENLYLKYESEGKATRTYDAKSIWLEIFKSQKEAGLPYMLYKDAVNKNNNQKNIGLIKCSNLCTEIVEYSSPTEFAVCTLASICVSKFVRLDENKIPSFDFSTFQYVVERCVRNLNKIIDRMDFPIVEAKRSSWRHRPIGIGIQGLADVFYMFNVAFDSPEAKQLNKLIFETLYYASIAASSKLCREEWMSYKKQCTANGSVTIRTHPQISSFENEDGSTVEAVKYTEHTFTNSKDIPSDIAAYSTYKGSPLQQGLFHWEMYGLNNSELVGDLDWESLKSHVQKFGVKNSLCVALMPTASTSTIMGNVECFEPLTSNVMMRTTTAGEFLVVNKYLVKDLQDLGLWTTEVKNYIKLNDGSIQNIDGLPDHIKYKYKTAWELSQRVIIDLASDRAPFVDQSQSLNLHVADLTFAKFTSMHMYSWMKGLKTGCYYLRSREAITPQKFTVVPTGNVEYVPPVITGETGGCTMCSS